VSSLTKLSFICDALINNKHTVSIFFLFGKGIWYNLEVYVFTRSSWYGILTERQFKVRLGSTYSDFYDQENGVQQGSILSVILFSIKMNSLVQVLKLISKTACL
jgi:hypothetical protein